MLSYFLEKPISDTDLKQEDKTSTHSEFIITHSEARQTIESEYLERCD